VQVTQNGQILSRFADNVFRGLFQSLITYTVN
jgi:hypothetical protein